MALGCSFHARDRARVCEMNLNMIKAWWYGNDEDDDDYDHDDDDDDGDNNGWRHSHNISLVKSSPWSQKLCTRMRVCDVFKPGSRYFNTQRLAARDRTDAPS